MPNITHTIYFILAILSVWHPTTNLLADHVNKEIIVFTEGRGLIGLRFKVEKGTGY